MELLSGTRIEEAYLSVTASPFHYSGENLALLILEDVTAQKLAEEALRQSEQWLAITLRSIGDAVVATDNQGRIKFMNPVAEGLMGRRLEEVRNKELTEVFNIINKDTRKPVENPVKRVLLEGITCGLANHTVLMAKDGTEIPIDDSAAPIKNDKGDILGAILVFRDVTEREKSEAQLRESEANLRKALQWKETLLKELYHRTKNNMHIISSLLALQMRTVKDDQKAACPFQVMQGRIMAMALVHEKLYQSRDLYNLDIRDYIEDLAKSIHSSFRSDEKNISLRLDVESMSFPIDQAIPCGLIINELMSNSMKYAFTGRKSGQIGIALHAPEADRIEMVFSDDGKGLPDGLDVKEATSLGLKIVHNLVQRQLDGEIECEGGRETRYRIRFGRDANAEGGA
ncbi:MAG: PAS domain S-box protein [Nitrospiraceae bacterium]|nr:PAS domain S-box protein [Nitrospiraceae bacterium]